MENQRSNSSSSCVASSNYSYINDKDDIDVNENNKQWKAEEAIAGNQAALEALREFILSPLFYSQEAKILGLTWPKGLLMYGPPGTGKTSLVREVVKECGALLIVISSQSVHRAYAGESEKILREAFSEAASHALTGKPSVIFIDEIDTLCPRRDSRRARDVRITSQLSCLMDANARPSNSLAHVVVVASTNRVDAIDPALRRVGRFDSEIEITTPTVEERFHILKLYTKNLPLKPNVDLQAIAASCNGYAGADLHALCRDAKDFAKGNAGVFCLTMEDWEHARSVIGPNITRGVTVEIPKVRWEDIGGLKDVKEKLQRAVEWPIKHSAAFSRMGISPVRGVLLHGPAGCSKTTLVKAAANAAQASLFSLSCADLYSMYVGEGEALLRNIFQKARLAAPSIIFFDEVDIVAAKRGGDSSNSSTVGERLLYTLLTEMDGLEEAKGILVLAATNRPNVIDAALMRPGRFDMVLYVPPPDFESRYEILLVHTHKMKIGDDVDLRRIAEDTEFFTGANLKCLCNEAGFAALREDMSATIMCNRHFKIVKESLKPTLTRADIEEHLSFMKTRKTSSNRIGSYNGDRGGQSHKLFRMTSTLIIGVLSFVLLALLEVCIGRFVLRYAKAEHIRIYF
ncbi:cell division control protein 48 homolog B-like [Mercurialis annua]|uniref:cell division control protein 48 homolog B-like n=1 Tax=Mercurialis annua TaxID=3986 RepID=UPI00215E8B98|nr:cell division control protein 48 homolog B-like [Mercurialis annua]XP_055960419.1 cell division control protein 48 homolog B-like [Mercurialis annua]